MAKEKVTITVDRDKLEEARLLSGAASASAAIDDALTRLLSAERLRRDIAAYTRTPPTDEEVMLALLPLDHVDLADDTDWDALYPEGS